VSSQLPSVGWEPFDREHTVLAERLGALVSAVTEKDLPRARAEAEAFLTGIRAHFAHEERLMHENGYADLERHKEAHDLFLSDAAGFAAELSAKGLTIAFRRWATARVLDWFRLHVHANDVALGAFLTERQRASRLRD